MRIQLDTEKKTIKVDGNVELKELVEALEKLLPKGLWKEFTLQNEPITLWQNPIIIEREVRREPYWNPPIWVNTQPLTSDPGIVYCSSNLKSGQFNLEV